MAYVIRQLALVVFLLSLAGPVFAKNDKCKEDHKWKPECPAASVPEIDVGSGASAIALLLGGGPCSESDCNVGPKAPWSKVALCPRSGFGARAKPGALMSSTRSRW